ncbi:MAG: hypothetical protein ACI9MF_002194, partial [Gammaproteobacteria bacterium]
FSVKSGLLRFISAMLVLYVMQNLLELLINIDGKGYKAYKSIQGAPFAEPSRCRIFRPLSSTGLPRQQRTYNPVNSTRAPAMGRAGNIGCARSGWFG